MFDCIYFNRSYKILPDLQNLQWWPIQVNFFFLAFSAPSIIILVAIWTVMSRCIPRKDLSFCTNVMSFSGTSSNFHLFPSFLLHHIPKANFTKVRHCLNHILHLGLHSLSFCLILSPPALALRRLAYAISSYVITSSLQENIILESISAI
jgi:hypothetical protein